MTDKEVLDWLSDYDHTKITGGQGIVLHWYDDNDRRKRNEGKSLRECVE